MFYVANKNRQSETSAYYITFMHLFVILFFNLLKTAQYLAHSYNSIAIYCNMQYIDILSILAILYCNIAMYQYIVSPLPPIQSESTLRPQSKFIVSDQLLYIIVSVMFYHTT